MTKRFFLVCAGVLCLAVAYHLGARQATAQAPGSLVGITQANTGSFQAVFAVDASGGIYAGEGCFGNSRPFIRVGQLPAGCAPTSISSNLNGSQLWVGCANGDIYGVDNYEYPNCGTVLCANIYGAPTATTSESWGRVKARYR